LKANSVRDFAWSAALALSCVPLTVATVRADEIKVATSATFRAAYLQLVPECERATHSKLETEFGPSMGTRHNAIPLRLERGEEIDVVILAAPALDDLIKRGMVRADSRVDLVQSKIGMAVKAGTPKPDISTVDALKRTLLAARSIAYSDSASGLYLSAQLWPKLGIADQLKSKARKIEADSVGELVAAGKFEIGFQQISELLPVKGIDIVGPLPPGAQRVTIFAAGIPMTSKHPEAAKALIHCLASPAAYPAIRKSGLEPASGNNRRRAMPVTTRLDAFDANERRAIYGRDNPMQELSGTTLTANLLTGLDVDEYFQRTDPTRVFSSELRLETLR
jgi:molybdate transport system substrate-binding protein